MEKLNHTADKSIEMAAGHVVITETAKQIAEDRKQLKEEETSQQTETKPQKRDTPELSKLSKWLGVESRQLNSASLKWILEMEAELWNSFLNWFPVSDSTLSNHVKELSDLYLSLLEALLTHTAGEEQVTQLTRLNSTLSEKLNLLMDADLKELTQFFNKIADEQTVNNIKSSIYKQTARETLSADETRSFFTSGDKTLTTGTLYQPFKNGSIQKNQAYASHLKSAEIQLGQRNTLLTAENSSERTSITSGKNTLFFTRKELEAANNFSRHLNNSGNLFQNNAFNAKSDELIGFLSAVTTIKEQIFTSSLDTDSAMKIPVKNAVNQMVDYYLSPKGSYKVYYHMTNMYSQTGNAPKTIEDGLDYAYQLFLRKKDNPSYKNQFDYSEEAGFFHSLKKQQTLAEELVSGLKFLEKNWKDFLNVIQRDNEKSFYLTFQKYSPWGISLKQRKTPDTPASKTDNLFFLGIIGFLFIFLGYYLLF